MNELATALNQVLHQRCAEYNRMLLNLLKMDIQMIVNMANTTIHQDENSQILITQLNDLMSQFDRQKIGQNEEFLYLSFRHHLKAILKNAQGINEETNPEQT